MKELLNEKVEHISLGFGVVTEIKDERIYVQFKDNIDVKAFPYPDVFGKFLKVMNTTIENSILEELHIKQEQIEFQRKEKDRKIAELEEEVTKIKDTKKKSASRSKKKIS